MKIVALLTGLLVFTTSCVQIPLKKIPIGAEVHSVVLNERRQHIDYISIDQSGGVPTMIDQHPLSKLDITNGSWDISVSQSLTGITEVDAVAAWLAEYVRVMRVLTPDLRPSSYELIIVPTTLTYRSQRRRAYSSTLMPISFVFSAREDAATKAVFLRVLRILAHEQYHIYQKLDIAAAPVDRISKETLAIFVDSCVTNAIFQEVRDPASYDTGLRDFILTNPTRAKLQSVIAKNTRAEDLIPNSEDLIQNYLAAAIVVRYLFDIMMEKPSRVPVDFSAELDKLCHAFGANTPTTWEGLLDLYTATTRNNTN